jgi:hypothetical protein
VSGNYSKLFDGHFDREDVMALPRSAAYLLLEMQAWSSRNLTDGRIPRAALGRLSTSRQPLRDANSLVLAGVLGADIDAFYVDWSGQTPAVDVEAAREANTRRQRGWSRCQRGEHTAEGPKKCPECNALANALDTALLTTLKDKAKDKANGKAKLGLSDGSTQPPPWCGDCDEHTRIWRNALTERLIDCPRCHPKFFEETNHG